MRQASDLRGSLFSRDDFPIMWDGSPEEELPDKVQRRLRSYDVLLEPALGALVAGAYWARGEQIPPFAEPFRAAASPPHDYSQFFRVWQDLDLYPALRLLYGVGVASALARNWGLLRTSPGTRRSRSLGTTASARPATSLMARSCRATCGGPTARP